ncbi:uncharacterized protein LOC117175545 [Belonocnema kinseyi]|uniref:uncharacterized protein LOC117175545 n=1 Tax=Belonocnema kinseyi TaxID=2817044 RepID=UPI00143DF621|nr:uncharacterized protein LOC117175545 [Belonocnema kinseyi]
MELYEALPLRTFCCVKVERLPPLPVKILLELRHNFIKCDSETALAKYSNRKRKSTENGHGATTPQRRALCDKNDNNKNSINSIRSNYLSQICGGNQESNVENVIRPVDGSSITLSNFKDNFLPQMIGNAEKSETVAELANINVPMQNCCHNVFDNSIKCIDVLKTAESTLNNKYVWKKERQLRITGSRCYSIFTYSQNNWLDKSRRYFWPKEISTDATRHGNEYEPVAREMYRKQTNQCVRETGLFVSKTEPLLSLD